MKVEKNRIDDTKYELIIEIEAEKVDKELDSVYRSLVGRVQIPGFRHERYLGII